MAWTASALIFLGVMLALSIRGQRFYQGRLHVRTMMLAVAFGSFTCLGGREVWSMWKRWDHCYYWAKYCSGMEAAMRMPEPTDSPEDSEMLRAEAEKYGRARRKFEYAMWHPWADAPAFDIRDP
jgi:hypothetical protein